MNGMDYEITELTDAELATERAEDAEAERFKLVEKKSNGNVILGWYKTRAQAESLVKELRQDNFIQCRFAQFARDLAEEMGIEEELVKNSIWHCLQM